MHLDPFIYFLLFFGFCLLDQSILNGSLSVQMFYSCLLGFHMNSDILFIFDRS